MRRCLVTTLVVLLAGFAASAAYAAKALTPKAQLEKEATNIIVGKVRSIASSTALTSQYKHITYVAVIGVDSVEKGAGLQAGHVVYAHYWSKAWIGVGAPPPDDSGHWPSPKTNDVVRVYLTGKNKESGYDVYFKNGFDILAPTRQPSTAATR